MLSTNLEPLLTLSNFEIKSVPNVFLLLGDRIMELAH